MRTLYKYQNISDPQSSVDLGTIHPTQFQLIHLIQMHTKEKASRVLTSDLENARLKARTIEMFVGIQIKLIQDQIRLQTEL